MSNIASEGELVLHRDAVISFKNINVDDVTSYNIHFCIKSDKNYSNIKKLIEHFATRLTQLESLPEVGKHKLKKKEPYDKLKKKFNSTLNMIRQQLTKESVLNNILFINDDFYFVSRRECHFAKRVNLVGIRDKEFISGSNSIIEESTESNPLLILRLSNGRCGFETPNEMLAFLMSCIEKTTLNDLVVTTAKYYSTKFDSGGIRAYINGDVKTTFSLLLKFGDGNICSSSPRIKHFLFGSNWEIERINFDPDKCSPFVKSTLYHQYNIAVHKRINQLIDMKNNEPDFPYITIRCCRQDPICNKVHITKKPREPKLFECSCNMQLCGFGCGQTYHGLSPCNLTPDEATTQLLNSHKICPGCHSRVHKVAGCNHITCRCGTQFCYICVEEYEKDSHNQYMVTEHHRDRCPQYDT
jgi:hypothetical protein